MFYNADFYQNLFERAVEQLGPDHACSKALQQAVSDHCESNVAGAMEQLNKLSPELQEQLVQQVHSSWTTDPGAILRQWPVNSSAKN